MKILALHLINHDANVCYYDGEKATYLNLERTKGIKKYHYYKWDMAKLGEDLAGLGIPTHLDAIILTCGELISSPEEEASMDWRPTATRTAPRGRRTSLPCHRGPGRRHGLLPQAHRRSAAR